MKKRLKMITPGTNELLKLPFVHGLQNVLEMGQSAFVLDHDADLLLKI